MRSGGLHDRLRETPKPALQSLVFDRQKRTTDPFEKFPLVPSADILSCLNVAEGRLVAMLQRAAKRRPARYRRSPKNAGSRMSNRYPASGAFRPSLPRYGQAATALPPERRAKR